MAWANDDDNERKNGYKRIEIWDDEIRKINS